MQQKLLKTVSSSYLGQQVHSLAFSHEILAAILLLAVGGCGTPEMAPSSAPSGSPQVNASASPAQGPASSQPAGAPAEAVSTGPQSSSATNSLVLQPGDAVQISFPGAPSLDRSVTIRRDGKISLDMIGDINAAGMTPNQLEKVLLDKYGPQLVTKEVNVNVVNSAFIVYVTGAVMRPGKLTSERALTPLQAVIEAGIDSTKSNLKAVKVIRTDDRGHSETFKLNLKDILYGRETQPFSLRPLDIILVPEKFTWF